MDLVRARAEAEPDHVALIHLAGAWTYRELLAKAKSVAALVRGLAHGASPRVALYYPNGPEYIALALGILEAGACLVPVPPELAIPEKRVLLEVTAPHLVLSDESQPWLTPSGQEENLAGINFRWTHFDSQPRFPEEKFAAILPAFIRFSSGTTGASKGVVIGHKALLARVRSANRRLRFTPEDRVLWTLPMAHHFAVSIMLYLIEGVTSVLEDSHLASDLLTTARASGATVFYGSPFHLALLAAEDSGRSWPTLRMAIGTAASVTAQTAAAFEQRYGKSPVQGLGIIEAGLPLLNIADPKGRPESVGLPDDFEVGLHDDMGCEVSAGEFGELWLRGPGMFDAYLSPWTDRAEISRDGWFATGDIAQCDADGFVFLRGRRKSVINFGGMKFFPEEVEEVLNSYPGVRESRVAGEPHERWGEVAVAEIVPDNPASPPSASVLARHLRDRLATYKIPVRYRIVLEIPRTASGKIRR